MVLEKPALKYLFVAELLNGDKIEQTPEDVSAVYAGLSESQIEDFHRHELPQMVSDMYSSVGRNGYTVDDVLTDLRRPLKSAYFDVVCRMKEVAAFHLLLADGDEEHDEIYTVELPSGRFAVSGCPFWMHEGHIKDVQLFFARRNHAIQNRDFRTLPNGQRQYRDNDPEHKIVGYRLGWTAKRLNDEPIERIMEIQNV